MCEIDLSSVSNLNRESQRLLVKESIAQITQLKTPFLLGGFEFLVVVVIFFWIFSFVLVSSLLYCA